MTRPTLDEIIAERDAERSHVPGESCCLLCDTIEIALAMRAENMRLHGLVETGRGGERCRDYIRTLKAELAEARAELERLNDCDRLGNL